MGSSSKKVTVGYRYFMGVHMGLVHGPVDCLVRMRVADKVVWTGGSTGGAITVAQNEIFGGDGSEGGVSGTVSFASGAPTQLPNNYLLGQLGSPLPAFRGVACAVLEHAYIAANNPYLKPWSFTMTRTDVTTRGETQWYVNKARIGTSTVVEYPYTDEGGADVYWDLPVYESDRFSLSSSAVTTAGNFKIFRVTGSNITRTLTVTETVTVDVLLIASGGGGVHETPGAGAGEVLIKRATFEPGTYTVHLGFRASTSQGSTSVLSSITAQGDSNSIANAVHDLYARPGANSPGSDCQEGIGTYAGPWGSASGGAGPRTAPIGSSAPPCDEQPGGVATTETPLPPTPGEIRYRNDGGRAGANASCIRSNGITRWGGGGHGGGGGAGGSGGNGRDGINTAEGLSGTACDDATAHPGDGGDGGDGIWVNFDGVSRYVAYGGAGWRGNGNGITVTDQGAGSDGYAEHGIVWGNGAAMLVFGNAHDAGGAACLIRYRTASSSEPGEGPWPCGECVDMNPAHIIRECLTDNEWGMGYLAADIDDVSFQAAADTLYDERMGISILWQRENTIEDFVQDIVRHIDAALYVDRRTGKFKLKLIRDDYDTAALITLVPSNIERIENYTRPAFGDLVNSVTVLYDDCNDGKTEAFVTGGGNDGVGTGTGDATALDCIQWGMFLIEESELQYILTLGDATQIGTCMAEAWESAKGIYSSSVAAEGVRDDMIARLTDSDTGYLGCQWTGDDGGTPRTAEILSIAAGTTTLVGPVIEFTWNWVDGVGADFVQAFYVSTDGRSPDEYKTECVS